MMRPIPEEWARAACQKLDLDQCIIYGRKEGADGGETIACAGSSRRNLSIAQEMVRFLKREVFGWKEVDLVEEKPEELPEGPAGGDPTLGSKIISPFLPRGDKKRKDF